MKTISLPAPPKPKPVSASSNAHVLTAEEKAAFLASRPDLAYPRKVKPKVNVVVVPRATVTKKPRKPRKNNKRGRPSFIDLWVKDK